MIDDDTYKALNIVHARHHPSFFKCGDAASQKQSGSLFTLLNRCQSRPGTQFLWQVAATLLQFSLLIQQLQLFTLHVKNGSRAVERAVYRDHRSVARQIAIRQIRIRCIRCITIIFYIRSSRRRKTLWHPTRNLKVLNERFEVIEFCLNPDNQSLVENLTSCLKHVYRLSKVVLDRHLAQQAKISDWRRLHKVAPRHFNSFQRRNNLFMFFITARVSDSLDDLIYNLHGRYV